MISAIVLAAGESKRMGQPKMLLPWGETTVIGRVLSVLQAAGVEDVVTVTGGFRERVEAAAERHGARVVFNAEYASNEMLRSIQLGLGAVHAGTEAALICLGDQPQVQEGTVRRVMETFERTQSLIVVPSYQMRRGHPWLVARPLWEEILAMKSPQSPRDFLNARAGEIEYADMDSASILEDLDTPEDYRRFKP